MIIRAVRHRPELMDNFDWFNDYKDTRAWLLCNAPEMVEAFDIKYEEWLDTL